MTKCLTEACTGLAAKRGVCRRCYQEFYRQVREGETTWERLEEEGAVKVAIPSQKNGFNVRSGRGG